MNRDITSNQPPDWTAPPVRFVPRISRSSSHSPNRLRRRSMQIDPLIGELSPNAVLEALATSGTANGYGQSNPLSATLAQASSTERAIAVRAATASRSIRQWHTEVSAWEWPVVSEPPSTGFEVPSQEERARKRRKISENRSTSEVRTDGNNWIDNEEYWGGCPALLVRQREARIETIRTGMEELEMEELENVILVAHIPARSRPSSGYSVRSATDPPSTERLDDVSAVMIATLLQVLPTLARLSGLLEIWSARLAVLRMVPSFLKQLQETQKELKSAWEAIGIRPGGAESGSDRSLDSGKEAHRANTASIGTIEPGGGRSGVTVITNSSLARGPSDALQTVLAEYVSSSGQKLDRMLDALEGREDTIPPQWIDDMEGLERDYSEWVCEAERVVLENELRESRRGSQPNVQSGQTGHASGGHQSHTTPIADEHSAPSGEAAAGSNVYENPLRINPLSAATIYGLGHLGGYQDRAHTEWSYDPPEVSATPNSSIPEASDHRIDGKRSPLGSVSNGDLRYNVPESTILGQAGEDGVDVKEKSNAPPGSQEHVSQSVTRLSTLGGDNGDLPAVSHSSLDRADPLNGKESDPDLDVRPVTPKITLSPDSKPHLSGNLTNRRLSHPSDRAGSDISEDNIDTTVPNPIDVGKTVVTTIGPPSASSFLSDSSSSGLQDALTVVSHRPVFVRSRSLSSIGISGREERNQKNGIPSMKVYPRGRSGGLKLPGHGRSLSAPLHYWGRNIFSGRGPTAMRSYGDDLVTSKRASAVSMASGETVDTFEKVDVPRAESPSSRSTPTRKETTNHPSTPSSAKGERHRAPLSPNGPTGTARGSVRKLNGSPERPSKRERAVKDRNMFSNADREAADKTPNKPTEAKLEAKISSILTTIPAQIRLTSAADAAESVKSQQPSTPQSSITRSRRNTASSESYTLAPAETPGSASRGGTEHPEVKLYHLRRSGAEAPIKLHVRLVGAQSERVMVRVGGGWADLAEYLQDYAVHHGRRSSADGGGVVEVRRLPSSSNNTPTSASRTGQVTPGGGGSENGSARALRSRPAPLTSTPLGSSTLVVRKTRAPPALLSPDPPTAITSLPESINSTELTTTGNPSSSSSSTSTSPTAMRSSVPWPSANNPECGKAIDPASVLVAKKPRRVSRRAEPLSAEKQAWVDEMIGKVRRGAGSAEYSSSSASNSTRTGGRTTPIPTSTSSGMNLPANTSPLSTATAPLISRIDLSSTKDGGSDEPEKDKKRRGGERPGAGHRRRQSNDDRVGVGFGDLGTVGKTSRVFFRKDTT
ncbi:MAG: hypothetical protein M1823_002738 [Watsoniomyces obsoletus]|nr:MAG: hypothetical protein M1823_002738 [Watsoniomyces obsoletus]